MSPTPVSATIWVSHTPPSIIPYQDVTWGGPLAPVYVAVAADDPLSLNNVITSADGVNWVLRTGAAASNWRAIAYGGLTSPVFVAVAITNPSLVANGVDQVMTSPDGINWTSRTSFANQWTDVIWGGAATPLFVAVSNNRDGNQVMTSPDGTTWTLQTTPNNPTPQFPNGNRAVFFQSLAFSGLTFVAVSSGGSAVTQPLRVMVSPNGINWAFTNASARETWGSVAYGAGLFVACNEANSLPLSGIALMTSSDQGNTWMNVTVPPTSNYLGNPWPSWRSITYGGQPGNKTFVAVGQDTGGNGYSMTSPDGLTWTNQTTPVNFWAAVTYGGSTPLSSLFVSVAAFVPGDGNVPPNNPVVMTRY